MVRQRVPDEPAQDDGGGALDEEHPLPPLNPEQAVKPQKRARQRGADHVRQGHAQQEETGRLRPVLLREPVREVQNDSRVETGLGRTEENTQDVEGALVPHECHGHGDESPRQHDPSDPESRPHLVHNEVRGDLEDRVADEEEPGSESVRGGAQPNGGLERLLRHADIRPIDERNDVGGHKKRHQAPEIGSRRTGQACVLLRAQPQADVILGRRRCHGCSFQSMVPASGPAGRW